MDFVSGATVQGWEGLALRGAVEACGRAAVRGRETRAQQGETRAQQGAAVRGRETRAQQVGAQHRAGYKSVQSWSVTAFILMPRFIL